jgi:hypothetical protein
LGSCRAGGGIEHGKGVVDECADFIRGGVVADYFEEREGFGFVCFADEFEDVV